ncbi:MAG TPA: multicopper oxidase domain-containing protein, partial [Chloroflexota bacterium]|nr:multicopper oxidase domain-containing protein [Chloroflexota bacterium]
TFTVAGDYTYFCIPHESTGMVGKIEVQERFQLGGERAAESVADRCRKEALVSVEVRSGTPSPSKPAGSPVWMVSLTSAIRAAFGVIWAVNAFLAWQPGFSAHYVGYLQNAAQGQPPWLAGWFAFWIAVVTPNAGLFVGMTRLFDLVIALGLLFGLARKWIYLVGGGYSLLIWATADGLGGPYVAGTSNLGPALVYVLVFAALIVFDRLEGRTPYSVDYYLEERWPGWVRVAEWAPRELAARTPPRLPWSEQGVAIVAILAALVFLFGSIQSALNTQAATPENAQAAVSPLSLMASTPIARARDATLPPLAGTGTTVPVHLVVTDTAVEIASGVTYNAWTFGGTVPGPIIHVRQGQTVQVTLTNNGIMPHSVDFHAAQIAPSSAFTDVNPGESKEFSFVATTPGVFLYHCGTMPVLLHISNGMYGALIVDPAQPLPHADASYVLVQGEWYTSQAEGTVMTGNWTKMLAATPDEVVFNGDAFQYKDHPLAARAGQRVRLYVVNAGPSLTSAFHVIGALFANVYPDGDAEHALSGVSVYPVAPGEGVVFDLVIPQPGKYPFVDHSMRDMQIGAVGTLDVEP